MSELYDLIEQPELEEPVLLVVLDGWIDAGLGAATALAQLQRSTSWSPIAVFDADELLDHRSRRPTMRIDEGVVTDLQWPSIELLAGTDRIGNDVLLLAGAEPDHRWRAFADAVADLALDLEVRAVHGLGAYPAPVPHTRPSRVVATATSAELAELIGHVEGRIDVPGGIAAAIEQRCAEVGVPAAGLWAQVPHYAAAMPYPAAGVALLDALRRVAGLSFDPGSLADEALATHQRIDALIQGNPDHLEMVRQLEVQVDDQVPTPPADFSMTGDELAAEIERFLNDDER